MKLLASDLAQATKGTLKGRDVVIEGANADSRTLRPGQLFVPIRATRDGHEFIPEAIARGATAYLTDGAKVRGATAIDVEDTRIALRQIAALVRSRLPDRVLGITGSVGKTSVKDMAGPILARTGPVAMTAHSYNNEIGAPLTLINANDDSKAVVMEMGARFVGNIKEICSYARPTSAVITNVGLAHVGPFGGVENIARAKAELVEALPSHGIAVLNIMDDVVLSMRSRTEARVLTFGINAGDVRATNVVIDDSLRPSFRLHTPTGSLPIHMHVRGQHQVINAVAAAAGAIALGVGVSDIAVGLESARLSQWRMELLQANTGATLINDAYNANPVSMKAALHALARLSVTGRRIAVLGPMAELGDISDEQHQIIGDLVRILELEIISIKAPQYGGKDVETIEEAAEFLSSTGKSDAILVKGSRSEGLENLVDLLLAD